MDNDENIFILGWFDISLAEEQLPLSTYNHHNISNNTKSA